MCFEKNTGVLASFELIVEEFPYTSMYLEGRSGRVARDSKFHNKHQQSSVLLVHKTTEVNVYGRALQQRREKRTASSARYELPREERFEDIGVVVSSKHPATKTYLHPQMADHLMNRLECESYIQLNCPAKS